MNKNYSKFIKITNKCAPPVSVCFSLRNGIKVQVTSYKLLFLIYNNIFLYEKQESSVREILDVTPSLALLLNYCNYCNTVLFNVAECIVQSWMLCTKHFKRCYLIKMTGNSFYIHSNCTHDIILSSCNRQLTIWILGTLIRFNEQIYTFRHKLV